MKEPQPITPIALSVLGGIALFVFFSFLNFMIGFLFIFGVGASCIEPTRAVSGAIFELIMTIAAAFLGYRAVVGGRPFRTAGIYWRTAIVTVAACNLVPWPCSVSGSAIMLGQNFLSHCQPQKWPTPAR